MDTQSLIQYLGALTAILVAVEYVLKLSPLKQNSYVELIDDVIAGIQGLIGYLKTKK